MNHDKSILFLILGLIIIFWCNCTKAPDYQIPTIKVISGDNDDAARLYDTIVYKIDILTDNPLETLKVTPSRPGAEGTDNINTVFNSSTFNFDTTYTYIVEDEFPNVNKILISFVVTNKIGTSEFYIEIELARPTKTFLDVSMDLTSCYFCASTGQVANLTNYVTYMDEMDFTYFMFENNPSLGAVSYNIDLPDSVRYRGSFTGFLPSDITSETFDNINDSRVILDEVGKTDYQTTAFSNHHHLSIAQGDIFGFAGTKGLKGLVRIDSFSNDTDKPIIISVKSFNCN
jgi:hypothetical protein